MPIHSSFFATLAFYATAIQGLGLSKTCDSPILESGLGNMGAMSTTYANREGNAVVTSIDLNAGINNKGGKLYVSTLLDLWYGGLADKRFSVEGDLNRERTSTSANSNTSL
jgi:hypothetical protein